MNWFLVSVGGGLAFWSAHTALYGDNTTGAFIAAVLAFFILVGVE